MNYETVQNGPTCEVSFRGKLTFADNAGIKTLIKQVEKIDCHLCVLNVAGLQTIDSAGLGMLLLINDALVAVGKQMEVSGAAGQVLKMFEISKFSEMITIR